MLGEIKQFLKTKKLRGVKSALQAKPLYVDYLKEIYGDIELNIIIYMVLNDIKEIPKAKCGNDAKFVNLIEGFSDRCNLPFQGKNKCKVCSVMISEKRKSTYKNKTGYDNPGQNPDVRDKMSRTNINRYGTTVPQQTDVVKKRSIETNLLKYGVEHPSMLEENKEKRQKTVFEKYGVDNVLKTTHKRLEERYMNFKKKYEYSGKYTLLSSIEEYDSSVNGVKSILLWKCNACNNTFNKVAPCLRCPKCEPYSSSTEEVELYEYISSIYDGEIIQNSRNIITGNEIDIFIPELKLGIEFNGEYWHRDEVRGNNYHQSKYIRMKENGNKLITIYSNEWRNKTDIVKRRLRSILNTDNRVYARKCTIGLVQNDVCDEFLKTYHIQGKCGSSIRVGLYLETELVAVMTFGKPRFNKEYEYELLRYCSKDTVVGGASKLLKYFENTYVPKSLISYADMNWSSGNLYEAIGFQFVEMTKPGYFYYDKKTETTYSRYQCQKQKLISKFGFPNTMTENEMTRSLGYYKIYDCGNLVYKKEY